LRKGDFWLIIAFSRSKDEIEIRAGERTATQVVKNIRRVRRTLEKIGIPRATFYRWYDLYGKADSSTSRMISSFSEAGYLPAATLLGERLDPHCTGRAARRGHYRRAVQNLYYRWSKDFLEAGKTFSRRGRSDWLAIRSGPRPRTRSRTCAAKPARAFCIRKENTDEGYVVFHVAAEIPEGVGMATLDDRISHKLELPRKTSVSP
jgi:hypothetical protein